MKYNSNRQNSKLLIIILAFCIASCSVVANQQKKLSVKIIATELTCGEKGPPVLIALDYRTGNSEIWQSVHPSQFISVGQVYEINLGESRGKISFRATTETIRYLSRECPSYSFDTDSKNSLLLKAGDSISEQISSQFNPPFDEQEEILTLLNPLLDRESRSLQLGRNEFVVLMELGTDDPNSPAFDMQDLIFRVKVE